MREWVARHDTVVFLILTYGISWPLWFVSGALTRTPVRTPDLSWFVAQIGVFAPAFAAMAVSACVEPEGSRRVLRLLVFIYLPAAALGLWIATRGFASFVAVDAATTCAMALLGTWILFFLGAARNRLVPWPAPRTDRVRVAAWSIGCLLLPAVLFLVAWAMTGGSAGRTANTSMMPVRELTPLGILAAFAMNLSYGGSLGEEPGWRGTWLPRLLSQHTPLAASLIISFWWALWHAPIDLSQGFGATGVGALLVRQIWTLPVTLIFTWVTLRAGGSLLPPLFLHTSINVIPDFALSQPARFERALGLFFLFLLAVAVVTVMADFRLRETHGMSSQTVGESKA